MIATVLVIVASTAVIMLTLWTWRQNGQAVPQPKQTTGPIVPEAPQPVDGAAVTGNPSAQVAMIEYSDFQCPYCGVFSRDTWPAIRKEYVESGKVLVAFRHLPMPMHQYARSAALSADCARRQGRFWQIHDLLFRRQTELDGSTGSALAYSLGLDRAAFDECVRRDSEQTVDRDQNVADALGISATPTFLIGILQDGRTVKVAHVLVGAQPFGRFKAMLDEMIQTRATESASWRRLLRR
jgi:protein-disulfide isomerase